MRSWCVKLWLALMLCLMLGVGGAGAESAADSASCLHDAVHIEHIEGTLYKVCDACGERVTEAGQCLNNDDDDNGYCDDCGYDVRFAVWDGTYYASVEAAAAATRLLLRNRESAYVFFEVTEDVYNSVRDGSGTTEQYQKFLNCVFRHTGDYREGDYLYESFVVTNGTSEYISYGDTYYLGYALHQCVHGTTAEQEISVSTKINDLISDNGWASLTGYEQVKAVYDWVCANVSYDSAHFAECDSFYHLQDLTENHQPSYLPHTAYNALFSGKSVCSGYAQLMYAIYNRLGVDCRIVSGYAGSGSHGWNIVELDGLYYFIDATWDSQLSQAGQPYAYFLRAQANMEDHETDDVILGAYEISEHDYGYAAEDAETIVESGTMGEIAWQLTGDGTLTFSGTGKIYMNPVTDKSLIRKIVIGEGITAIGSIDYDVWFRGESEAVFYNCANLETVEFGTSLTLIGDESFAQCVSLTELVIPTNVTQIGYTAFRRCTGLKSVTVAGNVTVLHHRVFEACEKLTSVTLPVTITTFEGGVFNNCTSLAGITLPQGLTTMGSSVFEECTALTSITLPSGVKALARRTFFNCTSLTEVKLNEGLEDLGRVTFYGCESLTQITLPESVTIVGGYCFCDTGITTVKLPDTMTTIPEHLFDSCASLTSITIPPNVTSIEMYAFAGCSGLTGISLPSGVTSIDQAAFANCEGLTEFAIPNAVQTIGKSAFACCRGLTSISIPDSVTEVGPWAFRDCTNLTRVDGCGGLVSIGSNAFECCTSLTEINIPDSVTSIGEYAFYLCSSLTSINIPDGVTSIDPYTFYACSSLEEINIPDSVVSVGEYAFIACHSMVIHCYEGSFIDLYAQENNLSVEYITREKIVYDALPADLLVIETEAFLNCPLNSVKLPDGVTTIGSAAFKDSELAYIFIPASVTSIADDAFSGCENLVIVGDEGSFAQEYAQTQGIYFMEQN